MKKWLERIGLRPKGATPVGTDLESGKRNTPEDTYWRDVIVRTVLFVLLVGGTLAAFPRGEVFEYTVQVGDTWRQPTLVAPFNFPIYKDSDRVASEREQARRTTPPYFEEILNPEQVSQAHRDTVQQQIDEVLDAHTSSRYQRMRDNDEQAEADSLRYIQLRRNTRVTLSPEQWEVLTENAVEQIPSLSETTREPPDSERLDRQMMQAVAEVTEALQRRDVIDIPLDSVYTDHIIVRNEEERIQRRVSVDRVVGMSEAFSRAEEQLRDRFDDRPDAAQIAFAFFRDTFQPAHEYLEEETEERRQQRAENVSPISGGVERGEVVVQQGERVSSEVKQKLMSLEREKNQRAATTIMWRQISGELILVLVTFFFFFFYLYLIRPAIWTDNGLIALIVLLFGLIVGLFGIAIRVPWLDLYAVPVALISVTLAIVFSVRTALFATLVLAFLGGQMLGMNLQYALAAFFGGMLGIFSVRDIKNRGQFFLSAALVFVGYGLIIVGTWLFLGTPATRLGDEVIFAAIGASFTIVVQPMLWVIERTFGITTDLTLLELSDTNRPLLKRLSLEAPGTFNHSMQVANLAEAAAEKVGANGLLVRVGAFYHDIGKMIKPAQFVENQRGGQNPHDNQTPRISAMFITRHVKQGLKMGKEEHLPDRVLQFIATHHGTARVEYFYQQALQEADGDETQVNAADYRYPGPRPFSKETGILLLADSVEAACRSLDEPNENNLRKLVESIFQRHIETGQLDDTDLTFKEIGAIKETFMTMLSGVYHSRVKYPGQEDEAESGSNDPWIAPIDFSVPADVSVMWHDDGWFEAKGRRTPEPLPLLPGERRPRASRPDPDPSSSNSGNGAPDLSGMPVVVPATSYSESGDDSSDTEAREERGGAELSSSDTDDTSSTDVSSTDVSSTEATNEPDPKS
ncbi:MAG: HD family phosphohydrolase [Bacteroidota bacterium]